MRKLYHQHREKVNYLLIGGWNTVFGFSAFTALYYLFHRQIHYLFIFIISNILGITNAYIGFKIFVFKTRGNYLREYLRFYLVYGGTLALNLVLLPVCVEVLHIMPVVALGGLLFISTVLGYLGHKYFSFSRRAQ